MTLKYTHPLEIDGQDVELTITALYFPATAPTREEPGEDEMAELQTILGDDGKDYTNYEFTDVEMDILEQAGFQAAAEFYETKNAELEMKHDYNGEYLDVYHEL